MCPLVDVLALGANSASEKTLGLRGQIPHLAQAFIIVSGKNVSFCAAMYSLI
jgi:hypothetical protein